MLSETAHAVAEIIPNLICSNENVSFVNVSISFAIPFHQCQVCLIFVNPITI